MIRSLLFFLDTSPVNKDPFPLHSIGASHAELPPPGHEASRSITGTQYSTYKAWYKRQCHHSSLGYVSPVEFER